MIKKNNMQLRTLLRFINISVMTTVFLTGCASFNRSSETSSQIAEVPVTENPSGEIYPGKVIWHDLVTPDPVLAGQFYEKLFGWQIDYQDQYSVVRNGGKRIAGILKVKPADGKTKEGVWIPSISVADVDAAALLVEVQGGKILKGPLDRGKHGRVALISDPQGADFVLISTEEGDPADSKTDIGGWLWDEVWTTNPETIQGFYVSVFGYDGLFSDDGYVVFIRDKKWRAGMRHVRDENEHRLWVPVVRVADPQETANRVRELGGIVWVAPKDAPVKGETALIADTMGALLLVQRWPPQLSTEEDE